MSIPSSPDKRSPDLEPGVPSAEGEVPEVSVDAELDGSQMEIHDNLEEIWIHLKMNYAGKEHDIHVAESDRVFDLKAMLANITDVPPERQKIIGLVKGKSPPDEERLGSIKLVNGRKFTLVGTPRGSEFRDPSALEDLPDVFNDLDIDLASQPDAAKVYLSDIRNRRKIHEITKNLRVNVMNPLRQGMRLLVLDLDYTILDTKPLTSQSLPPLECARPHLHEFLSTIYPYYDICIWSQTSWIWLETKLVELGMVGSDQPYKISFVLDKTSMFTVFSKRDGAQYKHSYVVQKGLLYGSVHNYQLEANVPNSSEKNTIHVDDLARNFALNPCEGLKISPFKNAHSLAAAQDRELLALAQYLVDIASLPDFRDVNHKVSEASNAYVLMGSLFFDAYSELETIFYKILAQ